MAASTGIATARDEDEAKAELVQVMPPQEAILLQNERLQRVQDELLARSLSVADASVRFAEVDPESVGPPQEWIDEVGLQAATVRWRIARASWLSVKESPVGIKVATSMAIGILRAKAQVESAPRVLHMEVVHMTAPLPQFPEQEIER